MATTPTKPKGRKGLRQLPLRTLGAASGFRTGTCVQTWHDRNWALGQSLRKRQKHGRGIHAVEQNQEVPLGTQECLKLLKEDVTAVGSTFDLEA
ncbi:hypothetical protein RHMOL_Rhmol13G0102300 [Rhododendron molle]|uniref:Uncharacterized protein n=1 Tax=Rhododendron molle TaxID=49168 RepID=A0ACC0L532_RHOML|nr:hypothetical protein RHMOL_Rhmol13G0102300 [Rhododendron molle]